MTDQKNGRPDGEKSTEPKSGTATLKDKKDSMSREFFWIGEKAVAYFEGKICWSRPGLTTFESRNVWLEKEKRECKMIHTCPDATDFENAEDGTKKLGSKIAGELSFDAKLVAEIDKITQELGVTAFHYVKELVPLLGFLTKYYHAQEGHKGYARDCSNVVCSSSYKLTSKINENLFHGTLEDLTGVKP